MTRIRNLIIPLAACVLAFTAQAAGPARQDSKESAAQQVTPGPATPAPAAPVKLDYAGSEACAGCHEDIAKAFARNPHFNLEKNARWQGKACEACHGMGSKHADSASADDIVNPAKQTPAKTDAICLACHRNQSTHVGRIQSGHSRSAIACTSCHDMHKTGAESSFVRLKRNAGVNQLCGSCHVAAAAAFLKPYHHRVPEGAMSCTSCHNPHSSFMSRNLRQASTGAEPGCVNCHGDKRGPFVFEHAPVRTDGCSTCHEPHGSVNPRMLVRQEVYLVCLECHSNLQVPSPGGSLGSSPPAFHDMRVPRYRTCTTCHQKIHGSNTDKGLLR
jgi:DmsE family decaheme c-type cytochrome